MGLDIDIAFSGIPVSDFDAGRDFYERLFGRRAEVVAHDTEVMWRLGETSWLYVVADAERAGRSLVALSVTDLDAALADVGGRGITAVTDEEMPGAGRKATFLDPDGNSIALIQVLNA